MPRESLDSVSVYRLLSSCKYLEALHLINKLLKKQPNCLIAQVWKCEALYGLGNISESEELMGNILREAPLDRRTLDSIAEFYRARGNYTKLVEVYENALKNDGNDENWRKALFECCGLAGDYKKQQQQALLLYKASPRMLFYCMAVVCLLQQAEDNPVALELAERMMMKQYDAGKVKSRNEILLLINVLERRGKFDEALKILDKSETELDALISTAEKRIDFLFQLDRWSEAIIKLKELLKKNPDNWLYYKQYLRAVLQLETSGGNADPSDVDDSAERAVQFLTSLSSEHANLRGPYLAVIELVKLTTKGGEGNASRLSQLFTDYFLRFGDKAICLFDLSQYISLLPGSQSSDLLAKLGGSDFSELDPVELQRRMGPAKHVSFLQVSRLLGTQTALNVDQRIRLCSALEECYRTAGNCERRDQYLLLLSQERSTLFQATGDSEHLVLAACALEDGLADGAIFALQVHLLQIYYALGASKAARKIYEQLRIQSVQVDTLVHLFLSNLSSTGHFSIAYEMWETALKILQQCTAESLEALVWCYRAGLFHRVEEFTRCARRFQRTITVPLLRGEKAFLELVMGEPSRAELVLARTRLSVVWDDCVDNRDLRALSTWDPPSSQPSSARSYAELLLFCKIREATISCLAAAVAYGKSRMETEQEAFRSSLDKLQSLYSEAISQSTQEREVYGTRLHQISQVPLPSLLEKLLEPDLASTEKICTMIKQTTESSLEAVATKNVKNPRCSLEAFVTQMEFLTVATVACGAARAGLAQPQRRRSENIVRALEASWTLLEGSLPVALTQPRSANSPESSTRDMVDAKLRDNYQVATDDLRKVIRKKMSYLHKLVNC